MPRRWIIPCALFATLLLTGAGGDSDDAKVLLALALILVGAKAVGDLFIRIGQPAVLGELTAGVLLGNLTLLGWDGLSFISHHEAFALLAHIGVVLLLFEVGLESNLSDMARTGMASLLVAIVGVVVPVGLGFGVHAWLVPESGWHVHLFVGAVLAATSVGITARVLRDLGRIASPTARVILGAAVIDDVLGLLLLAVVAGLIAGAATGEGLVLLDLAIITGKAFVFLLGAVLLGRPASRRLFKVATLLHSRGVLVAIALAFCFAVAGLARLAGLEPIIGAFAAGLVLDEVAYEDLATREPHPLQDQLGQLTQFLVPVFFVYVGTNVDLAALGGDALILAGMLTVAAVVGKQACSLVAIGDGVNRIGVGLGMIPRGEVGLVFAKVGIGLGVVSASSYAAIVVMVMVTTMVTPPVLAWWLSRGDG